uniref:Uncharacterized protein n=1 Tax=Oryza rufipogon TaxID=4529 RepID=A0A0E0QS82_ORYRU
MGDEAAAAALHAPHGLPRPPSHAAVVEGGAGRGRRGRSGARPAGRSWARAAAGGGGAGRRHRGRAGARWP